MSLAENTPQGRNKFVKSNVKDSRVLVYLNRCNDGEQYVNTEEENELVQLWNTKYLIAKKEYENSRCNSKKKTTFKKSRQ